MANMSLLTELLPEDSGSMWRPRVVGARRLPTTSVSRGSQTLVSRGCRWEHRRGKIQGQAGPWLLSSSACLGEAETCLKGRIVCLRCI